MQIQWFPGHMHKARTQIREAAPRVDLFIEVLDARIPYSSENPMLAELRGDKPCLKVSAKSDLADPELTERWTKYFNQLPGVQARAITTEDRSSIRRLTNVCLKMLPHKGEGKSITTMIVGIPNVGKSTLINILAGRVVAKTGNEPAITKGQQQIRIGDGITLMDTPGVLWPNVENKYSGYRLATTGAIKDTAMEYTDVAYFAAEFMLSYYYDRLVDRYQLPARPAEQLELLEMIGRRRGCLGRGGVVDLDRVSRIFLNELRGGLLGRITMETPEMMEREKIEVAQELAEKALKKQARDAQRKQAFKEKRQSKRESKRKS